MGFKVFIDGICQTLLHLTIPRYQEKNAGGKEQLLFERPGKIAVLGFEFQEGQEITAFVFYAFTFEQSLAKVPYPFIHDMAGELLSCAQSRVFCAFEKWGKEYPFKHQSPTSDTYWADARYSVFHPVASSRGCIIHWATFH